MRRGLAAVVLLVAAGLAVLFGQRYLSRPAAPFDPGALPAYAGAAWVEVNGGRPYFEASEKTTSVFLRLSTQDALGRCGAATACVGPESMPTEPRGAIGMVRPTGWHTVRYDDLIEGKYLYNRCHLLAYQLTGENQAPENLITGTRYLNTQGMLPFENKVAGYIRRTGGHVLYRVTPVFAGDELLARGVLMEALSVEDGGRGLRFCVYVYNVQPGIRIDYATGESARESEEAAAPAPSAAPRADYIANKKTLKFHRPDCRGVGEMKEQNKLYYTGSRDGLIARGYSPCGQCKP